MERGDGASGVASMSFTGRGEVPDGVRSRRTVMVRVLAVIGLLSIGEARCGPAEPTSTRPRVVKTTRVRAISTADTRDAGLFVAAPGSATVPGTPPATPAAVRIVPVVRVSTDAP